MKIALQVCAMSDDGPTDIQSGANSSTAYGRGSSLDRDTTEKLTKLTVVRSDSPLKSFGERKARERNVKIARGHQIFKNMESTLSDGNTKKKSLEQGKKERQPLNRSQIRKMMLPSGPTNSEIQKSLDSSMITADELINLFDLAVNDRCSMHGKFKSIMNDGNLCLSDEDWNRFACHVASIAVQEVRGFAVTAAIMAVRQKGFRSAFAQEINVLMSNYVLVGGTGQGLPELVAHLLIANWPQEHARCDLESNDILFYIISSIKGWLETIIGEADEIEEIESNCACALYEVCRFAQRKLWMKWPELVDECYAAARDGKHGKHY
ncbi:hypothetical protein ACH3XW_5115 [Acanthocheilonema viteae]